LCSHLQVHHKRFQQFPKLLLDSQVMPYLPHIARQHSKFVNYEHQLVEFAVLRTKQQIDASDCYIPVLILSTKASQKKKTVNRKIQPCLLFPKT